MTDPVKLNDDALQFAARLLARKVQALRLSSSAIGRVLLEQAREDLGQVRAEQERRGGI